MNNLDRNYKELLNHILKCGIEKKDRTGTGTKSIFGWQIRHNMKEGFPLLTTKKMYFKGVVTELLWFLRGDTNIKFLVDNDCHIWDGDAYKNYLKAWEYAKSLQKQHSTDEDYQQYLKEINILSKEEFINKIKTDDEFAKKWGELGPIYGKQWRNWESYDFTIDNDFGNNEFGGGWNIVQIDQIQNLINDLKTNPDSRRLMVNAWNIGELDQMVLPPCHYGFQVYTRELSLKERSFIAGSNHNEVSQNIKMFTGIDEDHILHKHLDDINIPTRAISLMWNQRSVDTFLGLPFNIASYGLLLEIIGKIVNMVPEELICNLGDTHIYNNHIEQAKQQLERVPYKLPRLNLSDSPMDIVNWSETPLNSLIENLSIHKDSVFKIENYQSHPAIKAPLSN